MTIIFQKNIQGGYIGNALMQSLFGVPIYYMGNPGGCAFTIYSGTQPTAAQIEANFANYNSSTNECLLHLWQSAAVYQPSQTAPVLWSLLNNYGIPTVETALHSGTASWAIVWGPNTNVYPNRIVNPTDIAGTTLPAPKFIVVPVSSLSGSMPLRLTSTNISSGSSYTLSDFQLNASGGIA